MKAKITEEARQVLKKLDSETLIGLNEIRKNIQMGESLLNLTRTLISQEKDRILKMDSADELLGIKHADIKGRLGGFTFISHIIEGSGDELERRDNES